MEIKYTNFDGDWNASCVYCGKPNQSHQVNAGMRDGITYIHHQPCDEQLKQAKLCLGARRGIFPRLFQRIKPRGSPLQR